MARLRAFVLTAVLRKVLTLSEVFFKPFDRLLQHIMMGTVIGLLPKLFEIGSGELVT